MTYSFSICWKGKPIILDKKEEDNEADVSPSKRAKVVVDEDSTISDLKNRIYATTKIRPENQKLVGLVTGKIPTDDTKFKDLTVSSLGRVILMGCPDEAISFINSSEAKELSEKVVDDFEWDYEPDANSKSVFEAENQKALEKMKKKMKPIQFINEPRQGKKLLVMDLDYTLFDCKSEASIPADALRRGTHEFLEAMYEHYDIIVWSQTSLRVLTMKLNALGIAQNANYKLTFILDRSCMFNISALDSDKNLIKHEVKALDLIWHQLGFLYTPENTVHVDDLARNFAMNPNHGVKVKAFRMSRNAMDDELLHLAKYLIKLASKDKFDSSSDHKDWKRKI